MRKHDGFPGQISYVVPEKIVEIVSKNPLINDLYVTDIGYYPHARHHFRERKHGIAQNILIYNVGGVGEIKIGQVTYQLLADHFFIIPQQVAHAYHADIKHPWSIYWIHFAGSKSALFTKTALRPVAIERGSQSRISERIDLFREIFLNLGRGYSVDNLEYVNLCVGHLIASFLYVDQYRLINERSEKDEVGQSINYMLEHVDRKLKLDDLSARFQLSVSRYTKLFTTQTGHSPIDYFIQLKIQRACRLLDTTALSITEVAAEIGIEDAFYFSRLFRKVMGMSPRDYRQR